MGRKTRFSESAIWTSRQRTFDLMASGPFQTVINGLRTLLRNWHLNIQLNVQFLNNVKTDQFHISTQYVMLEVSINGCKVSATRIGNTVYVRTKSITICSGSRC
jgi:hypothetical protein